MTGKIHSTESFGTVDGPGIRFVVFFQGCPMRCKYCHNPDTWSLSGGIEMTAEEIVSEYERNRTFYRHGGITATGGEPLLQIDFLGELFSLAKSKGIHTCLDTSGVVFAPGNQAFMEKLDGVMSATDLVMLDIKHIDPEEHRRLTGYDNGGILSFARYLEEKKIPVWIRHIVVPGITDDKAELEKLGEFIATLSNLRALDVLPYHTMGVSKYKELGIDYPLDGVPALSVNEAVKAKEYIISGIRKVRK